MIDIGTTEFLFNMPMLPRPQLEEYTNQLFDSWESRIPDVISLDDYSVILEIEEGSIKGKGKLLAGLGAVYLFVGQYGSFIQGIQIIRSQVVSAGEYLSTVAKTNLASNADRPIVKYKSGTLGQINKLFIQVHRGEISVDQAMQSATQILNTDGESNPQFMEKLRSSLDDVPVQGKQIDLLLGDFPLESNSDEENRKDSTQRHSKPRQAIIPSNLIRIEISRESKRGKKNIRIVEL